MEQLITCINCPVGCRMTVNVENGQVVSVTGNSCKRGVTYATQESVAPMRMVTAVVPVADRRTPVSVKTKSPVPKGAIRDCMTAIMAQRLKPPIRLGDVLIENVCDTGVDVIATKTVE